MTGAGLGTATYVALEQKLDAAAADARADHYSLGVILYELITGKAAEGRFKAASQRVDGVPRGRCAPAGLLRAGTR